MAATTVITCLGVGVVTLNEPVRIVRRKKERAIVENPAVGEEYDRGQDMGAHSPQFTIEGLADETQMDALYNYADQVQITASYPSGRMRFLQTDDRGYTIFNLTQLVIKSVESDYVGGFPQRHRFSITFKRFDQT